MTLPSNETPKIQKLDEIVINRIAAGEVIQRPANAIKEMIENSLDAKSKSIQVTVRSGGLKLLQIQDDGCGIRKKDMEIVCERFTTSKLSSFDDLKSISTYGFRGEALASISHVAHLIITTKTVDSPCAYKAKYEDGKMVPLQNGGKVEPKPCAGNKGTQITVEDLFYNVAVRRKALKNPNEEHAKITDVVSKYSIHNPSVAFSLKRFGQNLADVRTPQNSTIVDNIKTIYGPTISRELLEVVHNDEKLCFQLHGYFSNANYSMKKCTMLLFINHRLVDSTALRKALGAVYANYLPKDKHPFMYISLELNPLNLDVNVHPTKHEVKFLHEEMIIESIQKCVETKLLGANESRQYYTQTLLPNMVSAGMECPLSNIISDKTTTADEGTKKKIYAHQIVRTDAREQKIQAFFPHLSKPEHQNDPDSTNTTTEIDEISVEPNSNDNIKTNSSLKQSLQSEPNSSPDSLADWYFEEDTAECKQEENSENPVQEIQKNDADTIMPASVRTSQIRSNNDSNNNNNAVIRGGNVDNSASNSNAIIVNDSATDGKKIFSPENVTKLKRKSSDTIATSSGSTATSSGSTATSSGSTATSSGSTATSSGSTATSSRSTATSSGSTTTSSGSTTTSSHSTATSSRTDGRQIRLTSIKNLSKTIDLKEHLGLKNLLQEHKFVGCVNRALALVQHLTQLYLVNTQKLSQELFYQILIFKFGNFGYIELSEPAPIPELVLMALNNPESGWTQEDGSKDDIAKYTTDLLISKAEMLLDYFSIEINKNGELTAVPLLLDNYIPNWNGLPMLLLRLATEVDWDSEEECFHTFAREFSHFYAFGPDPLRGSDDNTENQEENDESNKSETEDQDNNERKWQHVVEHVLFPTLRTSVVPPREFSTDGTFLEVANLPDLYKVFERC